MNDNMKEHLSGLVDGETDSHTENIINALVSSRSLRKTWWRYHLISAALKRDLPDMIDHNLPDRITDAIAGDNIIFAQNRFLSSRYLKPAAGFAIAASVAALAIIAVQQHSTGVTEPTAIKVAESPVDYNINVSRYSFPVSTSTVSTQAEPALTTAQYPQMNSYLVNYNEVQISHSGVQGIIPYVRIIADEDEQ